MVLVPMVMATTALFPVFVVMLVSATAPFFMFVVVLMAPAFVVIVAFALLSAATAVVMDVDLTVVVVDDNGLFSMLVVVLVPMVMVVAMAVVLVLIYLVEEPAVIHSIDHLMIELVLVNIQYSTHECEVDLVGGCKLSVLLHTVTEVCKVKCDSGSIIESDRALDVTEHDSGLGFDPFPNFKHGLGEPRFGIGIPTSDPSRDSGGYSSSLFQ